MKQKYRIYRRKQSGNYYIQDNVTGKQESLGTSDKAEARRLLHTRNEAAANPAMNLQIARAYLSAVDPQAAHRTWQDAMVEGAKTKTGPTRIRWESAMRDKALVKLKDMQLLQTRAEHFTEALESGTVSTNMFLRRLHSFALDTDWLPWPVLPRKRWPKIVYGDKRGITLDEHQRILAAETNAELRDYYELLWHVGGSQTDMGVADGGQCGLGQPDDYLHAGEDRASGDCAFQRRAGGNVATPVAQGKINPPSPVLNSGQTTAVSQVSHPSS